MIFLTSKLIIRITLLAISIAFISACTPVRDSGDTQEQITDQSELDAIQQVVEMTYDASSFEDVSKVDPDSFRLPFTKTAVLGHARQGELVLYSVDDYVEIRRDMVEKGEPHSLIEWEINGTTELFGNIAHRMSSYAVRLNDTEELVERGVMSFQLVKISGQWKVQSLLWHAETEDLQIPSKYLNGMGS